MPTPRPVAQSLFPDLRPEKPWGRLPGSVLRGKNADLMATLADLYLDGLSVVDVTYGRGLWWTRYQPADFVHHDLAADGVDFRALPYEADAFDVVCFDPPYIATGAPSTMPDGFEQRDRYGIAAYRSVKELDGLMRDGLHEACRVARTWVLVKCMDYTAGDGLELGHLKVIGWADEVGWRLHDLIVHWTGSNAATHTIRVQRRCVRNHSYLIVLAPRAARRR